MRIFSRMVTCICLAQAAIGCAEAAVIVSGTNPSSAGVFFVANQQFSEIDEFHYEQLFTLSTAAQTTAFDLPAGANTSGVTLRLQFFSGLGMEGTGTLLQSIDVVVPQITNVLLAPTIHIPLSLALNPGAYSVLLTIPNFSDFLIYEQVASGENSPHGSLGGTHWSTGVISTGNVVFALQGDVAESGVPEPGAFGAVGMVLLAIGLRQRLLRRL